MTVAPTTSALIAIERNETISGAGSASSFKDPQVSFIILVELEP
jgi:hypothetical protein